MNALSRPVKPQQSALPSGYAVVLAEVRRMIGDSRRRALASVNRVLVWLYWCIGRVIVAQQEKAAWGDAVVERFSADLRAAFPDMKGLSRDNLFRMRQFYRTCCRTDAWLSGKVTLGAAKVGTPSRLSASRRDLRKIVGTPSRQLHRADHAFAMPVEELTSPGLADVVFGLSWSHHCAIIASVTRPERHYFYMAMAVRERWSVRELRRQLDADLFTRYVSVKRDPEKCLPVAAEQGDLLPFKDHYLLDFLGLEDSHTERQLRQAMLANLRDLFLELGRDFTFIGEEYPVVAGDDTFRVDLLFFHRRLQCLVATELKTGKFKPEYVGKCQFYLAALDEQVRLPHEKPSVGLILCKSANSVQIRLALTAAARKIGIATYQTVLPEERLILERLRRLPGMRAESFSSVPADGKEKCPTQSSLRARRVPRSSQTG